jgi:hypothetical protein
MKARIPVHAMFCERVDDGKQLANGDNQRDFLSLARDIQTHTGLCRTAVSVAM